MSPEQAKLITLNWQELVKIHDMRLVATKMKEKGIFEEYEIQQIFSTTDDRHNKRVFLFNLQEKDEYALHAFVDSLIETGHSSTARLLKPKYKCAPFRLPEEESSETSQDDDDKFTSSLQTEYQPEYTNTARLDIEMKLSGEFYDTPKFNGTLQYYSCRSKQRGRVLIINNYEFQETKHKYRQGAIVDEENLEKLFGQMGGWIVEKHSNKTTEQMRLIIKDFTKYSLAKQCDICFVCIMSHGCEELNKTIIYGIDGSHMFATEVQSYFTNEKCKLFNGKPKVFIYQVCRGSDIDISLLPSNIHTETDGAVKSEVDSKVAVPRRNTSDVSIRSIEDMLIGYATLQGYRAHRDRYKGTWYIELICQTFMEHARNQSVDHLLMMVDQFLRKRLSEDKTMQTSEHKNRGFKKLYLNPGIYEEKGVLKRF